MAKGQDEEGNEEEKDPQDDNGAQDEGENKDGAGAGENEGGEEFDKDRALATIKAQRAAEAKINKELTAARKELKKFQDAQKAAEDAEKSELTKAQEALAAKEAELKTSQQTIQALRLKQEFQLAAAKLKLAFASPQAQEDAWDLADLDAVTMDEAGKVTGMEDALKALQKSRPYLFGNGEDGDKKGTPPRDKNRKVGRDGQDLKVGVRF